MNTDTPSQPPNRRWPEYRLALLSCVLLYFWADAPSRVLTFEYYDNGETLLHTLNLLAGVVPYREDYNHHFFGYLLPFVALGKLFGVGPQLISLTRLIFQVSTAIGVFALCRMRCSFALALLGAALYITARAPMAFAFYPQHELATFLIWILFFCFRALQNGRMLRWASLLCGMAFVCDQRALLLFVLPAATWVLRQRSAGLRNSEATPMRALIFPALIAPSAVLIYLTCTHALLPFWEQTVVFPFFFRSASLGFSAKLHSWLWVHRYLITMTPFLSTFAAIGVLAIATHRMQLAEGERLLLSTAIFVLLGTTFFSGRDFQYYTIPFNPLLAYLAVCSSSFFTRLPIAGRRVYSGLLLTPVLIALLQSYQTMAQLPKAGFDDGASETISFLQRNLGTQDRLLVWGYRMDLQARLGRHSDYPFGNQIMIHPDRSITTEADRALHVFGKYEKLFLGALTNDPPTVVVTFDKPELSKLSSSAEQQLKLLLQERYTKVFEITRLNIAKEPCTFRIFRRSA